MTLDLDAIKARVAAATPGPWEWVCEAHCGVEHRSQEIPACRNAQYDWFALRSNDAPVLEHWATYADDSGLSVGPADATFIARARSDIPALIAEVERLRGVLEWYARIGGEASARLLLDHGDRARASLPPA